MRVGVSQSLAQFEVDPRCLISSGSAGDAGAYPWGEARRLGLTVRAREISLGSLASPR